MCDVEQMRDGTSHAAVGRYPKNPAGKAVIAGTRLAVEFILALLVAGESGQVLMANYPALARENILACLSYAG